MRYLRDYIPYLRSYRHLLVSGVIFGLLAGAASGFGIPVFLKVVFAKIFEEKGSVDYSFWQVFGIAMQLPAVFLARGITSYANQYLMTRASLQVIRAIRQKIFDKLQALPLAYFERNRSGDLMSRLVSDATAVQTALIGFARDCIQLPATIVGGVGYVIYISLQEHNVFFLLLIIAVAPFIAMPIHFVGRHLKRRGRQVQEILGSSTDTLQENLRAALEIRAFNLEEAQRIKFGKRMDAFFAASMKLVKYEKMTQPLMELLAAGMISIAFVYAYFADIQFDIFFSIAMASYFAADAAKRLAKTIGDVQKSEGASARIAEIIDELPEESENMEPPPISGEVQGRVQFDDVHFSYGEGPVFEGLSVDVAKGTFCALVGPSGSGKSTFIKLLARFYSPQSGKILIDDTDLSKVSAQSARDHMALVPQAPVLFNDTILENIRVGNPQADREQIEEAAKAAFADEFIQGLPQGYDTIVGENAVKLSGGQRQRIALARAFLRNAEILILDEATSALDSESERRIQQALEANASGRTVFAIAHRFSTIQKADRILLFEKGQITGDGTLSSLMEHPTFHQLYQQQQLDQPK